jgi:DNA ligase 1
MDFIDSDLLLETLDKIAATPAKKDKANLVATFSEAERLVLKAALDPTVTYYLANLKLPDSMFGTAKWGQEEFDLLAQLSARQLTGDEARQTVDFHMRELTKPSAELLRRVINKDLRCGIGAGTVNAAFPGLIPDFPYMRCSLPKDSSMKDWDWSQGMISQLKANGMFARVDVDQIGNVIIASRQGNQFYKGALGALEHQLSFLDPDHQYHGELTLIDKLSGDVMRRSEANGILNSVLIGEREIPDNVIVVFDVWDCIPLEAAVTQGKYSVPYVKRFHTLLAMVSDFRAYLETTPQIQVIPHQVVYSYAEAMQHYKSVLARGLEGTVVCHPEGIWKDGDSKDKVKLKLEVDVDLRIKGFKPGTPGTRTEHTFGSVILGTSDDKLEVAAAGLKRDLEEWLHNNREKAQGMIMAVRANEVSPPCETNEMYSLYHPRVIELRHDKVEADSLDRVLAQFDAAVAA